MICSSSDNSHASCLKNSKIINNLYRYISVIFPNSRESNNCHPSHTQDVICPMKTNCRLHFFLWCLWLTPGCIFSITFKILFNMIRELELKNCQSTVVHRRISVNIYCVRNLTPGSNKSIPFRSSKAMDILVYSL